jgi:hypothetical protein
LTLPDSCLSHLAANGFLPTEHRMSWMMIMLFHPRINRFFTPFVSPWFQDGLKLSVYIKTAQNAMELRHPEI